MVKGASGAPGSCSATEINDFDATCLNANTASSSCDSASQAGVSSGCYKCLVSSSSASTWGVLLDESEFWQLNAGGCYAAEAAAEATCGADTQYQLECELAECNASGSATTFSNCQTTADKTSGKCGCFATNAATACAAYTGSSACNPTNNASFDDAFIAAAQIMCE